jgi:hypothetical protein
MFITYWRCVYYINTMCMYALKQLPSGNRRNRDITWNNMLAQKLKLLPNAINVQSVLFLYLYSLLCYYI